VNPGRENNVLGAVDCTSSIWCMAVGSGPGGGSLPFAEVWNGRRWRALRVPVRSSLDETELGGVDCVSRSFCVAVGWIEGDLGPTTVFWDGTAWHLMPAPAALNLDRPWLRSVSCAAVNRCVAIGTFDVGGDLHTGAFSLTWDGAAWTLARAATPAHTTTMWLQDVACATPTWCMAVGTARVNRVYRTLAERWNGSRWVVTRPAYTGTNRGGLLASVSCTASAACMAVGTLGIGHGRPVAYRWNGTRWRNSHAARAAGIHGLLEVSCGRRNRCVAVGAGLRTETWNGSRWRVAA
jgi:hypothetical protein